MGTHPIFESDFDCLTDDSEILSEFYRFEKTFDFEKTRIQKQIRIEQS